MDEQDPFPAVTLDGSEKRITNRIKQCWSCAGQSGGFPTLEGMYGQFLGDFWDRTFVVEPQGAEYWFKEIGDVFAGEFSQSQVGADVSATAPGTLLHCCVRDLSVIQTKRAPAYFSGEYVSRDGQVMLYRSALFPLASPIGNLSILGAGWHRTAN